MWQLWNIGFLQPVPWFGRRGTVTLVSALLLILSAANPAHSTPGDLDRSFGRGGKVTTDFGGTEQAFVLVLQPDGKFIIAGFSDASGSEDFAIARYNPDGTLDPAFGQSGKVTTDFGGTEQAFALVLQPDGKFIIAGVSDVNGSDDFALTRYNPDGTLDPAFGQSGKVTTDFGGVEGASALVLQPDGKLAVAGGSCGPSVMSCDFALARYNSDGTLDASFGIGGKVTTDFGGVEGASALVLQPDGKLAVAGFSCDARFTSCDFALARYNSDGTLDASFGIGGKVTTDFGGVDSALSLALQPDGKLVVTGSSNLSRSFAFFDFALARYNSDGTLDASFGIGGKVTTDFKGFKDMAFALVLQPDGRLVVAGYSNPSDRTSRNDFALARYNPDGGLDPQFGHGGKVTTDFDGASSLAFALALQPDGRLVVAGSYDLSGNFDFAMARYKTDTTPPNTLATPSPGPNANGWNATSVTVTLSATDDPGGTGVKEISYSLEGAESGAGVVVGSSGSVTITAEGTTTLTYFARDRQDNEETPKTLTVRIDKTPPTLICRLTPGPNARGWNNTDVTVQFTVTDALSGVDAAPGSVNVTTEGRNQAIAGTATDKAGNSASATCLVNIDKTPPSISATSSPAPNASGWNNTDVTVSFRATDALSGVSTVSSPVTVVSEGAGQVVNGTTTDGAGNSASVSVTLNIDKTAPAMAFRCAPLGQHEGDLVLTGTDGGSGGVTVTLTSDTPRSKGSTQERRTYTITDTAGNSLVAVIRFAQNRNHLRASLLRLSDNRNAPIVFPPGANVLNCQWVFKPNETTPLKDLEQRLKIRSLETDVRAHFDVLTNKSVVWVHRQGAGTITTYPGVVFLHLTADQGHLGFTVSP